MSDTIRTLTKINWVRRKAFDAQGHLKTTIHTGARAGWTFQIETVPGQAPKLVGNHEDGRHVSSGPHATLNHAKEAAMALLHPAEAMGWISGGMMGPVKYRAEWDRLRFVVYVIPGESGLFFQWRDTVTGTRSEPQPVFGISEGRQLARGVLRDAFPTDGPARTSPAAGDPVDALARALCEAGIEYTDAQFRMLTEKLDLA